PRSVEVRGTGHGDLRRIVLVLVLVLALAVLVLAVLVLAILVLAVLVLVLDRGLALLRAGALPTRESPTLPGRAQVIIGLDVVVADGDILGADDLVIDQGRYLVAARGQRDLIATRIPGRGGGHLLVVRVIDLDRHVPRAFAHGVEPIAVLIIEGD